MSPASPTSVLSGLVFQLAIKVGAVLHHLGQVDIGAQLTDEPGRVSGRSARQFKSFNDDDIFPAHLSQVIGDTATAHAAADDDDLRV